MSENRRQDQPEQKHFSTQEQLSFIINKYQYTIDLCQNQCPEWFKLRFSFWTTLGIAFVSFMRLNKVVKSLFTQPYLISHFSCSYTCSALLLTEHMIYSKFLRKKES